ncbi:zinc transporter ZIP6 isoform X1 [Lutzomyia longipalpis]|uniref:zinc transporter ZIP6 isoform X1 n=1 Tax=Lutzomyia longipalpis TaxID=7200 RepID=UPI0024834521|nr:zinc transporter ZIP6 isoform X1 [Lutzomyia longipalpis]
MWKILGGVFVIIFLHVAAEDTPTSPPTPLEVPRIRKSPPNKYLAHIFTKYGSRGEISFEGLEHLMHSLGLGGLEFGPEHTIDEHLVASTDEDDGDDAKNIAENRNEIRNDLWHGVSWPEMTFKELHDPKHRHRRHHVEEETNTCLSPLRLVEAVLGSKRLPYRGRYISEHHNGEAFVDFAFSHLKITPMEFMEICPALVAQIDQHACPVGHPHEEKVVDDEMTRLSPILATVAILVISLCGLVGIAVVPLMKYSAYQDILHFLVALAVGTLVGDALMHLLPHAFEAQEEATGHNHSSTWICFGTFMSGLLMFLLENLLSLAGGGHSHGSSAEDPPKPESSEEIELNPRKKPNSEKPLTPLAIMVILGDGLHNLTDGLAIGSSFAADPIMGMTTAFAVLCHELPHELGDFALLLKTGVTLKRVIILNIISSALSFIGMGIGLFLISLNTSLIKWIYAFTAGSFLHIGLADLVPELTHGAPSRSLKSALIAILGILTGGLIMLVIALNEHKLVMLFN